MHTSTGLTAGLFPERKVWIIGVHFPDTIRARGVITRFLPLCPSSQQAFSGGVVDDAANWSRKRPDNHQ